MKRVGLMALAVLLLGAAGLAGAWMHGQLGSTVQAATLEVGTGRVITVVGQDRRESRPTSPR